MSAQMSPAYLLEIVTGKLVQAELWDAIRDQNLIDWEDSWSPVHREVVDRMKAAGIERADLPQNRHWDWRRKAESTSSSLANPSFCVTRGGMTQGMMILDTLKKSRIPEQHGKELIYVEYLENAPWNRKDFVNEQPRYAGVGSLLIRAAIEFSRQEGFKGRLGLHSLPQSNGWYANKCGMTNLGVDANLPRLQYFEMTPKQADAFIAGGNEP